MTQTGLSSPSHGVLIEPWRGRFVVENLTSEPLVVSVSALALRSEFAVGKAQVVGWGDTLYFRHPHLKPPSRW